MKEQRKIYLDLSVILPQAVAKTSLYKKRSVAENALPDSLKSALPTIEEIERELSGEGGNA